MEKNKIADSGGAVVDNSCLNWLFEVAIDAKKFI